MRIVQVRSVLQHVKGGKTEFIFTGIRVISTYWPVMASGTRDNDMKEKDTEITVTPPSPVNGSAEKEQEFTVRFNESVTARRGVITTDDTDERDVLQEGESETEATSSGSKPKKSLFEITSVISTGNDFSRGESLGNDVEDSELDDTLSETQENVGSLPSLLTNTKPGDNSQNHFSSRFRIVKILRTEPYRKGRWNCQESVDPEVKGERQTSRDDSKTVASGVQPSSSKHESVAKTAAETIREIVGAEGSGIPATKHETTNHRQSGVHDSGTFVQETLDRTVNNNAPQGDMLAHLILTPVPGTSIPPDIARANDQSRTGECSNGDSLQSVGGADCPNVPIVNTIENALDQITVIKSTLLTVVKTEVEKLKETILQLTEENNQLKEENEKLKSLLGDEGKPPQSDSTGRQ